MGKEASAGDEDASGSAASPTPLLERWKAGDEAPRAGLLGPLPHAVPPLPPAAPPVAPTHLRAAA